MYTIQKKKRIAGYFSMWLDNSELTLSFSKWVLQTETSHGDGKIIGVCDGMYCIRFYCPVGNQRSFECHYLF